MITFQRIIYIVTIVFSLSGCTNNIPSDFTDPPREFSVMPFWFWNDTLKEAEIIRQIADFEEHGVYGFVIHPRIGLPENVSWLSPPMIDAMNIAIREAARRKMYVILYDEGMYPSGSSSGQVVARNPSHAARGLAKIDLKPGEKPLIAPGQKLITIINRPEGKRVAIIDRPSGGVIRGLHFIGEGTDKLIEQTPPAGDILNPDAVTSFIELVYDRYAKEFGDYFGTTILGIFTDEPSTLGRESVAGLVPGNRRLVDDISKIIGYDITPFLSDLWYNDTPDSEKHRIDYNRAINISLENNYYRRLGNWCLEHGIALMGHPSGSMDIGAQQFFQVPGQDLVWRYVEPGSKALDGHHSTMAKCASSAMIHLGLRRNSNELYGAYGHNLTFDEMNWLANWCFVRGQNMLFPHAFYYSVRGPRLDERPPDVGPNAKWWDNYKPYADACSRLSWINTDSRHVCDIAILGEAEWLPDKSAKILYQNQRDFNYLEIRHLINDCTIDEEGVHIADMTYKLLIIDSLSYLPFEAKPFLEKIAEKGQLVINKGSRFAEIFPEARTYGQPDELIAEISRITPADLIVYPPSTGIRYRHVVKGGNHYYIIFNEEEKDEHIRLKIPLKGNFKWLDPYTGAATGMDPESEIQIKPHELKILFINGGV
jgi:hypothetical protein